MGRLRPLASALAGVAGVLLVVMAARHREGPDEQVLARARRLAGPRDLIVVAADPDPSVVARLAPDAAVVMALPSAAALEPFRRVLTIGAGPSLRALMRARFGTGRRRGPGLQEWTTTAADFDALSALERARVRRGGQDCPRSGARHRCSGAKWRTVERQEVMVEGQPLRCVFGHPSDDGLEIVYPVDAPLARLRGVAALSDRAAARPDGPPVELVVSLDQQTIGRARVPNRPGLHAFSFAASRGGSLKIAISSTSQGARSFCLLMWGFRSED